MQSCPSYQECSVPLAALPSCVNASHIYNGVSYIGCQPEGAIGYAFNYPNVAVGFSGGWTDQTCLDVKANQCGSDPNLLPQKLSKAFAQAVQDGKLSCEDPKVLDTICANLSW